jgi:hypothetical protein
VRWHQSGGSALHLFVKEMTAGGFRSPSGGDDEWYTRPPFIEAAREVLGGIDLDPASCAKAQKKVKAARYFTKENDGLAQEWQGRVWMNPPFSIANKFGKKLRQEYDAGNVEAAIMVINSYSANTKWFRPFWNFWICMRTQPAFYKPGHAGNPVVWPAFVYLGPDPTAFATVFGRFGSCVKDASRDRTLWERSVLDDQWFWLALEEERLSGVASEMPERDFVREGVEWSRVRLDAEWELLRFQEGRIFGADAESELPA